VGHGERGATPTWEVLQVVLGRYLLGDKLRDRRLVVKRVPER
jgi:hypothetical protein